MWQGPSRRIARIGNTPCSCCGKTGDGHGRPFAVDKEADHASRITGRGDSTPHARERLSSEAGRGRVHVHGPGGEVWHEGQKESEEWARPFVPGWLDVDDLVQPFLIHSAFAR